MTQNATRARRSLLASASLALALPAGALLAQDKPADHGDTPAAAYEPSMTTLGQLSVEIPGRKPDDPVMTAEEVDALLDAAVGTHFESLIVLVANTGCRIGEALALRWSDVDLDKSTATIRRASITSSSTKTAAGVRTVPLLPEVVAALKVRRSQQRADRLKMGPGWADTEGLIFTTGVGTPVDAHNARRNLRSVLKAAGLPQDRPWHTMRHSLATRLLNRGVPMPVVASILGHASIRTTVDIYGHAEPAINADALAEVMGR